MKDEIKEILKDMDLVANKNKVPIYYSQNDIKIVLDYITNLREKLEVSQTNEETYRLEMLDITKCLGLDEDAIFDEVKEKATNLQEENERLKVKYDNSKSHQINYNYFKTLYEKATKDIVIDDLVYKCEDLDNLRQSYEKLYIEKEDCKSKIDKTIEILEQDKASASFNTAERIAINTLKGE